MAPAALRSRAMVLMLLIYYFVYLSLFVGVLCWYLFWYALLWGGGSVVVGLLFNVQPIVCRVSVFVFVLLYHYLMPILVLQSS